jgi:hypothetical protein
LSAQVLALAEATRSIAARSGAETTKIVRMTANESEPRRDAETDLREQRARPSENRFERAVRSRRAPAG